MLRIFYGHLAQEVLSGKIQEQQSLGFLTAIRRVRARRFAEACTTVSLYQTILLQDIKKFFENFHRVV